jgi:hypothetical protein
MELRNFSPRFIAVGIAPRYGSRDEYVGTIASVLVTAETRGWLDHKLKAYEAWLEFGEFDIDIIDTEPEKVAANWGPKPKYGFSAPGPLVVDDLPF